MSSNPLKNFLSASSAAQSEGLAPVDAILDAVRHHLGMEIAFASRYVGGRRQFTHIRASIPVPSAPGDSEPNDETYCHHILEGRLPELIHNGADIPFAQTLAITSALPVGAHMDVPLRLKDGSVYGSFCCLSRTPDYTLTERDLSTLRAFADLAAVQIEQEIERDRARAEIRARIEAVIAQEQLTIVYQPIHRLADGRPVGVEALARFADQAERTPDLWFAEAADVGLGVELELLAVRQAIRGLAYVPGDLYLAVNVSPATALAPELASIAAAAPADRLVVEVTEHSMVADYGALREALARLRGRARIAIDDVGAGYSGLRQILALGPDILKLDMSLTRDVDTDPARAALAQALVAFAQGIGCQIVAEGIETAGEMNALRALGVGSGQGWHFSRAMPPVALQHFLLAAGAEVGCDLPARPHRRRA
jgi:EAL domain-containing protein (putative c-di-GMP-specific phosphodiesterase class I)